MKRFNAEKPAELTEQERETIETLVNYPNLENVFAAGNSEGIEKIKQKMRERIVELERIIRRGTQTESDKATRILNAYQTSLNFLEEIERFRRQIIK